MHKFYCLPGAIWGSSVTTLRTFVSWFILGPTFPSASFVDLTCTPFDGMYGPSYFVCQLSYTSLSNWSQKHQNVDRVSIQYYHLCLASVMYLEALSYVVFMGNIQIGTWWIAYRWMFVSLLRKELIGPNCCFLYLQCKW